MILFTTLIFIVIFVYYAESLYLFVVTTKIPKIEYIIIDGDLIEVFDKRQLEYYYGYHINNKYNISVHEFNNMQISSKELK